MIGARLVTIAMLYSTNSLQCSTFAVMPRTHLSVKRADGVAQNANVFEEIMRQHGHHHVEFKRASRRRGPCHGGIAAEHLRANLHHRLAHDRIHFARHDG